MSSDPDRSISFQLSDMFSITNKHKLSDTPDHTDMNVSGGQEGLLLKISASGTQLSASPQLSGEKATDPAAQADGYLKVIC